MYPRAFSLQLKVSRLRLQDGVMSQNRSISVRPVCHFESPTMSLGPKHLRLVHTSDPRFCVHCGSYSGRSFSVLYSHIYRNHKQLIQKRGSSVCVQSHDETSMEIAGPRQLWKMTSWICQVNENDWCIKNCVCIHMQNCLYFY